MGDKINDIDYSRLVQWLIPPLLRKTNMVEWLLKLVKPVIALHLAFRRYRNTKLYQLKITPQVCYLEQLLNDKYDFTLRRIYIDDPLEKLPVYIFKDEELKPVPVYLQSENSPVFIYTEGEAGNLQDDFIIYVPTALVFSSFEMLELVKGYRLAGMKAKIQRV